MSSLVGLCSICGKQATQSCSICGALVCLKHINSSGACIGCSRGKRIAELR